MKLLIIIIIIVMSFSFNKLTAQTITTGTLNKTVFCVGDTMVIPFSTTGSFDSNNTFVPFLSHYDYGIIFSQEYEIFCETPNSITIIIYPNTEPDNEYWVNIKSTSPKIKNKDKETNLSIYQKPINKFELYQFYNNLNGSKYKYNLNIALAGDSIKFDNHSDTSCISEWDFGSGSVPRTFTGFYPPPVCYTKKGTSKAYLTVINPAGCKRADSIELNILDCYPKIDSNTYVVNTIMNLSTLELENKNIWVTTKGVLNIDWLTYDDSLIKYIFVESGGVINTSTIGKYVIFVKPGGLVNTEFKVNRSVYIHSSGDSMAGLTDSLFSVFLNCDNIIFDYTDAPLKGKIAMNINTVNDNPQINKEINIYPNPNNGIFKLLVKNMDNTDVIISDVLGNIIYRDKINNDIKSIDLSTKAKGIFFVKTISGKNVNIKKLVVD